MEREEHEQTWNVTNAYTFTLFLHKDPDIQFDYTMKVTQYITFDTFMEHDRQGN